MNRSKINLALQTKISSFRYTFFELQIIENKYSAVSTRCKYIYKYILAPCTKIFYLTK